MGSLQYEYLSDVLRLCITWKSVPHILVHWYGFSPVWICMCFVKVLCQYKALPHILCTGMVSLQYEYSSDFLRLLWSGTKCLSHTLHWYGFSPVWIHMCSFKFHVTRTKHLSHILHWYGFSPVWILKWVLRLCNWEKRLSHILHWYGFSPVWIHMWRVRLCDRAKHLSHTSHWYGFSLVCIHMWHWRLHFLPKYLSHTLHWCCFFPLVCCWSLLDFERLETGSWDALWGMFASALSTVLLLLSPALVEQRWSDGQWSSLELSGHKHIVLIRTLLYTFWCIFLAESKCKLPETG